jgi:hypothetical protein
MKNTREMVAYKVVEQAYGWVVGGYENSIMDGHITEMPDNEQLVDEIYDEVMQTENLGRFLPVKKDLRFIGKKRIEELIRERLKKGEMD